MKNDKTQHKHDNEDGSPVALDHNDDLPATIVEPDTLSRLVPQLKNSKSLKETPRIICKACHFTITSPLFLISVGQSAYHVFTNPSGMTFDVQTFDIASGCIVSGTFTDHFSWFPGYQWQYAYCEGCGEHLGWHYKKGKEQDEGSAEGPRFFALITDHLTFQN
ncbi:hypothetical protein A9Q81_07060 [Gammaproteobacteria bacterium 42_54_T18]|nr:hypothetical protein A9Q81_07060 [Gammaproteobacteria bacterium 42_54_T18]